MQNELIGGALIGLAAAILWLGIGRISGMASAISSAFEWQESRKHWAYLFLLGLLLAWPVFHALGGESRIEVTSNVGLLIAAGGLVGLGTYIGNGCTSGHGVCGTARFSTRSIVATLVFMVAGIATVAVMNSLGV